MKIHVLVLALLLATSIHGASTEKVAMTTFGDFVAHSAGIYDFWQKDDRGVFEVVGYSDPYYNATVLAFPIRIGITKTPRKLFFQTRIPSSKAPWTDEIKQGADKTYEEALAYAKKIIETDQYASKTEPLKNAYIASYLNSFDEYIIIYGQNANPAIKTIDAKTPWVKLQRVA